MAALGLRVQLAARRGADEAPPHRRGERSERASAPPRAGPRSATARRRRRRRRRGAGPARTRRRRARGRECGGGSRVRGRDRSDSSVKGSVSACACAVSTGRQPELRRRRSQRVQHPGGDVGRGEALEAAQLHQVQREVAGAGADLQGMRERLRGPLPQRLDQLLPDLVAPDRPEVDAPLGVVLGRGGVVVALLTSRMCSAVAVGEAGMGGGSSSGRLAAPRGPLAARPARGRAAARAHRRAHAAGRPRGELLVPAPPRRLRVDRRARRRHAGGGPRLRRGVRVRGPRRDRTRGHGRRRESRGPRTRALALYGAQPPFRAGSGRGVRRPLRRDRVPADDRAHPRAWAAPAAIRRGRAAGVRLDAEPAHAGA